MHALQSLQLWGGRNSAAIRNSSSSARPVIAKLVKKGRAVLDKGLPSDLKSTCHVLETGDVVYDATLNQTNIASNNNKYYAMQVLESDDQTTYYTFSRWGRVGSDCGEAQSQLNTHSTQNRAVKEFERKFKEKTKNSWDQRNEFVAYPGKYTLLEMDYEVPSDGTVSTQPENKSKLDVRVHELMSLICNMKMMKQHMSEIGYNSEKMPLGKLSRATILKGYRALKNLAAELELDTPSQDKLLQLSNDFYTIIPHNFGHRSIRDQMISTKKQLKRELEMVEALGEIQVAAKVLKQDGDADDPAFAQYKRLKCELNPLGTDSESYALISKYLRNTHGHTHSNYKLEVEQVFEVNRDGEGKRFESFEKNPNRMLLWHGSRLTNWAGILSQGLRIAPPEAPCTGYMFGKGVYFADMVSKSANYCHMSQSEATGILLLCEVALGNMNELLSGNSGLDVTTLPPGKSSTKGLGRTAPDPSQFQQLPDGLLVPLGLPAAQESLPRRELEYNEYIVYNTAQIRMRYLLQVLFKHKRYYN